MKTKFDTGHLFSPLNRENDYNIGKTAKEKVPPIPGLTLRHENNNEHWNL